MFDTLFSLFGAGSIHRIGMVVSIASNILKAFETEFAQDKNAKNAAIDTICELLQKHKEV